MITGIVVKERSGYAPVLCENTPMKRDKVPGGRFWEPEDDRTDEELMGVIGDTADIPELPFE